MLAPGEDSGKHGAAGDDEGDSPAGTEQRQGVASKGGGAVPPKQCQAERRPRQRGTLVFCGPEGYPGMAEVASISVPPKLLARGVTDMVSISPNASCRRTP